MHSKNRNIYLLGAGGHGRVVLDALLASGARAAGILDPALPVGQRVFDVEVLGADERLSMLGPSGVLLLNGVGANPDTSTRRQLFDQWRDRGYEFATVTHPSAVLGRECVLVSGAQVMAGAILQSRVRLGHNVVINTGAVVEHDSEICDHAFIGPGAVLNGNVVVEAGAFVGAGVVVLPNVRIGEGAIVGAGAVVTDNVPRGWTVVGSPAVRIGAKG